MVYVRLHLAHVLPRLGVEVCELLERETCRTARIERAAISAASITKVREPHIGSKTGSLPS